MTSIFSTSFSRITGLAALCAAAALGTTSPAWATDDPSLRATLTLASVPADKVSVSRDATATEPAADFRVAYTARIYNPFNSSKNFRFVGNLTVEGVGNTPPTQFLSSRSDCTLTSTNPVQIVCPRLEVAKRKTLELRFEFRTPTVGTQMNLMGNLFFPATNGTLTASTTVSTPLVKLAYVDYTLGFNTFVPTSGGTFFSGAPSTLAGSPGGVATQADPFTTTVVIPPIPFTTTAAVGELQQGERPACEVLFVNQGCFESNITIPSNPGALAGMKIYLRIDRTRHIVDPTVTIDLARIGYAKDTGPVVEVPTCSATVVATSGNPCIRARKQYGGTADIPAEWRFDWEFLIEAVDNGRYVNL